MLISPSWNFRHHWNPFHGLFEGPNDVRNIRVPTHNHGVNDLRDIFHMHRAKKHPTKYRGSDINQGFCITQAQTSHFTNYGFYSSLRQFSSKFLYYTESVNRSATNCCSNAHPDYIRIMEIAPNSISSSTQILVSFRHNALSASR